MKKQTFFSIYIVGIIFFNLAVWVIWLVPIVGSVIEFSSISWILAIPPGYICFVTFFPFISRKNGKFEKSMKKLTFLSLSFSILLILYLFMIPPVIVMEIPFFRIFVWLIARPLLLYLIITGTILSVILGKQTTRDKFFKLFTFAWVPIRIESFTRLPVLSLGATRNIKGVIVVVEESDEDKDEIKMYFDWDVDTDEIGIQMSLNGGYITTMKKLNSFIKNEIDLNTIFRESPR